MGRRVRNKSCNSYHNIFVFFLYLSWTEMRGVDGNSVIMTAMHVIINNLLVETALNHDGSVKGSIF